MYDVFAYRVVNRFAWSYISTREFTNCFSGYVGAILFVPYDEWSWMIRQ